MLMAIVLVSCLQRLVLPQPENAPHCCGEQTEQGVQSATAPLRVLNNIALVVVDDWTDKTGRPKSSVEINVEFIQGNDKSGCPTVGNFICL